MSITLHGVSRPLTIAARLEFGDNSLRAQGGFNLKQSSFGIRPVSIAGGTIKVKDELKFTLRYRGPSVEDILKIKAKGVPFTYRETIASRTSRTLRASTSNS